jgi:hypothetical protein
VGDGVGNQQLCHTPGCCCPCCALATLIYLLIVHIFFLVFTIDLIIYFAVNKLSFLFIIKKKLNLPLHDSAVGSGGRK